MIITKPTGVFFYDNAQDEPHVSSADWGTSKRVGWGYFSGGDHNTDNKSQTTTWTVVSKGQEGAPDGRLGAGSKSYRSRVIKRNDYPACCEWVRSELYWGTAAETVGVRWIGVSIYIPTDFCVDNRAMGIGFDCKFANAQGPASFYLKINNRGYIEVNRQYPQGGTEYRSELYHVSQDFGKWVDWTLNRNFSNTSSGFMILYRNGQEVWRYIGPNYGAEAEGYVLQGQYIWPWASQNGQGEGTGICNTEHTIYYAELKFGDSTATLQDMLPSGSSTTTLPPVTTTLPPANTVHIDAGSNSDRYYSGGSVYSDGQGNSERFGNFSYSIPVPNGSYSVKLTFEEIFFSTANSRLFNVDIGSNRFLTNYDIVAEAGASYVPVSETYIATAVNGKIDITFSNVKDNAKVTAIDIAPYVAPTTTTTKPPATTTTLPPTTTTTRPPVTTTTLPALTVITKTETFEDGQGLAVRITYSDGRIITIK